MTNNRKTTLVLIAIIAALLGLNIFFLVDRSQKQGAVTGQKEAFLTAQTAKAELQIAYDNAILELNKYRSDNEQLNRLIDAQTEEINRRKKEIEALLQKEGDQPQIRKAKEGIAEFVKIKEDFTTQLEGLRKENLQLSQSNKNLTDQNTLLNDSVTRNHAAFQKLNSVNQELSQKTQDLENKSSQLESTLKKAAVLQVAGIKVTPQRTKRNKDVDVSKASKAEKLHLCFDIVPNVLVPSGSEVFSVRIMNPAGESLVNDKTSSITDNYGNIYTYSLPVMVNYNGEAMNACADWKCNSGMHAGLYTIEIYNRGMLVGKGTFKLS